jgi:hypothetical protein
VNIISALCTECVGLVQGETMTAELEDLRADRFDLAALDVDLKARIREPKE